MGAFVYPMTSLYKLIYNKALTATWSVCETHFVRVFYHFLDKLSYGFCLAFLQPCQRTGTHTRSQYCSGLFPVSSVTQYGRTGLYTHSALPTCQCTVLTHQLTALLPLYGVYITFFLHLLQALCAL